MLAVFIDTFTNINLSRTTHVRSDVKLENGFSSEKIFSVKNVGKAEAVWVEHEDEEEDEALA